MSVGGVLCAISSAGLTLASGKTRGTLKVYPAKNITPELAVRITEHKAEIIQIMREDEEMRRTGSIQHQRQVFELAREFFGANGQEGGA